MVALPLTLTSLLLASKVRGPSSPETPPRAVKHLILNVDDIEKIQESGRPFEADLPREFIDQVLVADPPTEFHANGEAHVSARLTKMGRKVLVQATYTVPLVGQCKRCLKPLTLDEPIDMTLTYVPQDGAEAKKKQNAIADDEKSKKKRKRAHDFEPEASFELETVDEEGYTGKQIDLTPAMREQILLSIPPSPVCREDCKGLCAICGKDLNEGACDCDRTVVDPRWEALKAVQLDKKE